MSSSNRLKILNVSHIFEDGEKILDNISFDIQKNSTVAIVGPSGVGKTTLFNIIAGLTNPSSGNILLNGEDITNKSGNVSYMLQKDLLLPFRTVYQNISLPLEIRGEDKEDIQKEILPHIKDFGLEGLLDKYPRQISGGQRQRVALLRTYMFKSKVMLLDEPFSALDYLTKNKMYDWFNALKKRLGLTCLLITHDIDEALHLADYIYVMANKPANLDKVFKVPKDVDTLSSEMIEVKRKILKEFN